MTETRDPASKTPRWTELAVALSFLVAAVALTWPMCASFGSKLGGDPGDPFQTLWSWRWMHDALASLSNPFFTDRVFHPQGSTLVFETFDVPTAVLTVPLWHVLSPFGVYNAGVLFAFWLTAYGMYRLVKELTGDTLVAAAAGILFTATPYHLAHAAGHQHLSSMGWLPLYFLYLVRMIEGRAQLKDAALGGLFLALASLASWYHLLYAIVGTAVLFVDAGVRHRKTFLAKPFFLQAIALAATYLALAGPLLVGILVAKSREPVYGAHDAVRFSGDLYAFFFPNLSQAWHSWWGSRAARWTGNSAETALYAGYALLATSLVAMAVAGWRARAWFAVALAGALLSLGPKLHLDGRVTDVPMPYALLEKALPQIEFMGVPVRLGYVMYLGLVVCAALGLSELRKRFPKPALASAFVALPFAFGMAEYLPHPFFITDATAPKPMVEWAKDPKKFAVLDVSDDYRMMFHAAIHRKPMTGGNLTRIPDRLNKWYWDLPIVQALRRPGTFRTKTVLERVDPRIDFHWPSGGPPGPGLRPDAYRITWTGTLTVPRHGEWTFYLTSDDGSQLSVDGAQVVDNGGAHPMQERSGMVKLSAGAHPIELVFEQAGGDAGMRFEWAGPGQSRQVVPADALKTGREGDPAGLRGVYQQGSRECALGRAEGRQALRAIGVRYVVTSWQASDCLTGPLALPETYRGEGVRIFEVPEGD